MEHKCQNLETNAPLLQHSKYYRQVGCHSPYLSLVTVHITHTSQLPSSLSPLLLLLHSQLYLQGSPFLVRFLRMWLFFFFFFFKSNHRGSHILSLWMVHAGWVFVASIHPSRTWMSGSIESTRLNACVHRLDLSLCSHLKEFWGNGVRNHANSKGKIPFTGGSEEAWTCDAESRRTVSPTHYRLS